MEAKLKQAMNEMPTAQTKFTELEEMAKKPHRRFGVKKFTVVIVAAVLALVLCGMGYAKTRYGMWMIYGSRDWSDLQKTVEEYDLVLPETLDGSPFLEYNVWGLVPRGAPWMQALVNPSYKPVYVDYAVEVTETETYPSGEKSSEAIQRMDEMSVYFGTTKNQLWRYHFQFDENGVWTACDIPESYYTLEYKGITIQVGDTKFYDSVKDCDRYTHWAHWVDEEMQMAFGIAETDYSDPERVVECAKQIIDLNR